MSAIDDIPIESPLTKFDTFFAPTPAFIKMQREEERESAEQMLAIFDAIEALV